MIEFNDLVFSEGCCAGHSFFTEKVREDGIGFVINRKGDEETYTVEKYAADKKTKLETKTELTTEDLVAYLNA